MKETIYSGSIVSQGMALGKAFIVSQSRLESIPYTTTTFEEVQAEEEKLWVAIEVSISELQSTMKRVREQMGERESKVFEVHIMMLHDRRITTRMADRINFEKISAETAVQRTFLEIIRSFRGHGEEFREKFSSDLRDLGLRLIKNLSPFFTYDKAQDLTEPVIVVGRELTPSLVARLDRKWILGFATEIGSPTTHAGILVSSMGVPAVSHITDYINFKNGDQLYLDARSGKILLNPSHKAKEIFDLSLQEYQRAVHEIEQLTDVESITKDGHAVRLLANIWMPEDLDIAKALGAQGVGLIRTEFLYLFQNKPPLQDDVNDYYRELLEKVWGGYCYIRLLDVGGEMELPAGLFQGSILKYSGLKFLLEEKRLLEIQLRAALKVSKDYPVCIVYPFFETSEDLKKANDVLSLLGKDFEKQNVKVGALIETLEAIEEIESILDQVSFVILGSNDLILRLMKLSRQAKIDLSNLNCISAAFLKKVERVMKACSLKGKDFYFSGKMSEDALYLALFVGMGVKNFNMAGSSIPRMKKRIASLEYARLSLIASEALKIEDDQDLKSFLMKEFKAYPYEA